jgi:histidinol dehydrogenase
VDKIVGPGNAYVASAKRQVFGAVGIDSIAGPSEIVIIADKTGNPAFIAADLLSQVEHGSGFESGVLLTESRELVEAVRREVRRMLAGLERAEAIRKSLASYGALFVCRSLEEAVGAANIIAPEHLEIQTEKPRELLRSVLNAGAVFLGPWSSEPVGDYYAGTNHVLPTNGSARFSSSLGVADFQKDMSVVEYGEQALRNAGTEIMLMARTEGLTAHENAVGVRCRNE